MTVIAALVLAHAASFLPAPDARAEFDAASGGELTLRDGVVMTDIVPIEHGSVSAEIFMVPGLAFTGILFRAADADNGELFYFRHHQRGNPDAWQYHPRYHGHEAYQIYQGSGFGGRFDTPVGQWATIELTFCFGAASVTVDGKRMALMSDLVRPSQVGKIGFWALRGERRIRNVRYSELDPRECAADINVQTAGARAPETDAGAIGQWRVTAPMTRAQAVRRVGAAMTDAEVVFATHRGIADLNTVGEISGAADSLVARAVLTSAQETTAMLDLGFSDDAAVYLNGELLFEGSDRFRSRDYRFLGTMGFFDSIALQLAPGDNLLDVVVTEIEGGWGVAGRLRNADGVTVGTAP